MSKHFQRKRYLIQAMRDDPDEDWEEWTSVDDYDAAVRHSLHVKELGFRSRIVDTKGADSEQHKAD